MEDVNSAKIILILKPQGKHAFKILAMPMNKLSKLMVAVRHVLIISIH